MRKITGQFTKYTVILLIVGAILVLAGGLSVGRKAIANQVNEFNENAEVSTSENN